MTRYQQSVRINAPIERVFHFHDNTENLLKITPPSISVSIQTSGEPGLGYEVVLKVRQFGFFTMRWRVRITEYDAPHRMVDEQISGPFAAWKQIRDFSTDGSHTILTDTVEYEAPFGVLGRLADRLFVHRQIASMFAYRQQATKDILERG